MRLREWVKPPRHLVVMFFGVTLVSAASLGWLSWKVIQQDRALARQQAQEGRETAAHLLAAALQKNLSELEERLTSLANLPETDLSSAAADYSRALPEDSVFVILRPSSVEAYPAKQLLYYPALPNPGQAPSEIFAEEVRMVRVSRLMAASRSSSRGIG